jgi:hypothetical protein
MCCPCEYSEDFLLYGDEGTCGLSLQEVLHFIFRIWRIFIYMTSSEALLGLAFKFFTDGCVNVRNLKDAQDVNMGDNFLSEFKSGFTFSRFLI